MRLFVHFVSIIFVLVKISKTQECEVKSQSCTFNTNLNEEID